MAGSSRPGAVTLCPTHQYLRQVDDDILTAVFGNVGSLIARRLGNDDAEAIASHFDPYTAGVLGELSNHEIIARVPEAGASVATLGRTAPLALYEEAVRTRKLGKICYRTGLLSKVQSLLIYLPMM